MNKQLENEYKALKLRYPNWDTLFNDEKANLHYTFMHYIGAAVEVGLVRFTNEDTN